MMNEKQLKGILKILTTFISPDKIQALAKFMLLKAIEYKNSLPMDTEAGETQIAAMAWEHSGEIFTSIVFLDSEDKIIRYNQIKKADELIETLVNKL